LCLARARPESVRSISAPSPSADSRLIFRLLSVRRFISRLGTALNVALRPPYKASNPAHLTKTANAIHSIVLCKGTELYGYRVGYSYFLRIAYLRPSDRYKLMRVLAEGAVLELKARIYEGHLSFVLQFMADFGLGGCGWLDLADVRFRSLPDETDPAVSPGSEMLLPSRLRRWTTATTAAHYLHPQTLGPTSRTALELDVHVGAILNRLTIVPRELHHDFVELAQGGLGTDRKLVDSLEELWEDERRRRRAAGKSTAGENDLGKLSYGTRLGSADEVPGRSVGWGSEPRWWAEVDARIAQDRETLRARATAAAAAAGEDIAADGPTPPLPSRKLEDLLAHAAGRRETAAELARWDRYIPTTFRALTRGWPRTPMPSAAPEPLPAQSQHLPTHDVRALEDDSTAAVDGWARRADRSSTTTPRKEMGSTNVFSAPPTPGGGRFGDDSDDGFREADVDARLVFEATQRASQLESEERQRLLDEGDALDYLHPPEADDGTFDAIAVGGPGGPLVDGEDDREVHAVHGRPVDPWGADSGFEGDLTQIGGRSRVRIKTETAGRQNLAGASTTTPRAGRMGAAASTTLVPLSRPVAAAAYPYSAYFSASSTRAERKSRSPGSAVRTSPLKRTAGDLTTTTSPRSPSTLRTVRYSQLERVVTPRKRTLHIGKAEDNDNDNGDELVEEESPSVNRVSGRVKLEAANSPSPVKPSAAMAFTLGPRPAQPIFGSPTGTGKAGGRALAPMSSFAPFGRDRLPDYVLPTFVPPTFPQSRSPTPSNPSDDDVGGGAVHGHFSPPSSLRETDTPIPLSPPESMATGRVPSDDAQPLDPFEPTFVSPTATALGSDDDNDNNSNNDNDAATERTSSPESDILVMTTAQSPAARPVAKPSPLVPRHRPRALVPATSALVPPSPEPERPRKRVRYVLADETGSDDGQLAVDGGDGGEQKRTRELSSSREEVAIPAAQLGPTASGIFALPPPPTQAAGGRELEPTTTTAVVSSVDASSSAGPSRPVSCRGGRALTRSSPAAAEHADVSMDVSIEMAVPPTIPSPSLPSSAPYDRFGVHRGPYYSDPRDLPKPREYAGRIWSFSTHAREEDEEPLDDVYVRQEGTFLGQVDGDRRSSRLQRKRTLETGSLTADPPPAILPRVASSRWEFGFRAVTRGEATAWLDADQVEEKRRRKRILESQHAGSTQKNTQGFKFSQIDEASRHREKRFMSVMVLEILGTLRVGLCVRLRAPADG